MIIYYSEAPIEEMAISAEDGEYALLAGELLRNGAVVIPTCRMD